MNRTSQSKKMPTMKHCMIGDSGVGKVCIVIKHNRFRFTEQTSIVSWYLTHQFNNDYKPTIGVNFETKSVISHDKSFCLNIWDTAGLFI